MNPIEGQIHIDIHPYESRVARVEISSSRPLQLPRLFIGKTPEEALSIIPLMYSVCGTAHSRAALKSMQQCMQLEFDPGMEIARDMLLLLEIGKEHLMRILLDWPKLFDIDTGSHGPAFPIKLTKHFESALFSRGRAFTLDSKLDIHRDTISELIENLRLYLHDHVFSANPSDWMASQNNADIQLWCEQNHTCASQAVQNIYRHGRASQGSADCPHLPGLEGKLLLDEFDQDDAGDFLARPKWQGHCFETTALSRQLESPLIQSLKLEYQNSLITRWMARLVELAKIPQQLTGMLDQISAYDFDGIEEERTEGGVTQVESARGRLIHRVEMEQGLISNYQVLAPTEWNFHPQGVVSRSLSGLNTDDQTELCQLAHLVINAIDPCVGYELRAH